VEPVGKTGGQEDEEEGAEGGQSSHSKGLATPGL
jgi:hypothetical protein